MIHSEKQQALLNFINNKAVLQSLYSFMFNERHLHQSQSNLHSGMRSGRDFADITLLSNKEKGMGIKSRTKSAGNLMSLRRRGDEMLMRNEDEVDSNG